ncbi:aldehyde dehydrogenase family protein [Mycolicibacterium porcinum]|uniref:Aldehyde dehydrogenase n=1 Tax=Mycolicibacterium porcinum TaxID=39693 RepID=A0AAW5SUA5_9MYCO|nr:aldehyde dehydrogenase family protein [Mycolicibacterium porcinum]MCV7386461.1 aldehyde dehydrogenase [Mycolicibacterium porcinum]ORB39042.1 aldehyde dehydrogenase [Mycolicibacterium porcinum]CDO30868.1 aldehyde dehydrogenase [Mycolicibacterium vulneris]
MTIAPTTPPVGLLVGEDWRSTASGGTREHVNAATGTVQAEITLAGPDEVDEAVRAARGAFADWRRWHPTERRRVLQRLVESMTAHRKEFIALSAQECGIPVQVGQAIVQMGIDWADSAATWADKVAGEVIPSAANVFDYTLAEPYGVVAVILTWNGPAASMGISVMPALAAGCCVVVKPSELAPFSALLFARLAREAGVPAGVINVVTGDAQAGAALVAHPGVDKVSFTGGIATAQAISAACSRRLTPLLLELGGKSANIVFDDADRKKALKSALGIIVLSGQGCIVPSRLLVQDSIYDEFVEQVTGALSQIRVGDPFDPKSVMGPVISDAACDRILGFVDRARNSQAGQLLLGGDRLGGELSDGYYLPPTVFGDVDNASELAQEEIFGPVLAIMRFTDEEHAVAMANDTQFGLAGFVHTTDMSRAVRVSAALDVGNVGVNGGGAMGGPEAPFGGVKQSGYGREGGKGALLEFLRIKNVMVDLD